MAVNPASGKVYVTNTEAHNDVRFEGHDAGFASVRGHIADSRITRHRSVARARSRARNLNSHIDYTAEGDAAEKALSVAFPQDLAFTRDGSTLYTVAQGSAKLAIYSTERARGRHRGADARQPGHAVGAAAPRASCSTRRTARAYVLTRFDNSISIVDLGAHTEIGAGRDVQPRAGERHRRPPVPLRRERSRRRTARTACASCHIGGDKDELAWDLGNPGGARCRSRSSRRRIGDDLRDRPGDDHRR